MLSLFNADGGGTAYAGFADGLRRARLEQMLTDAQLSRRLARAQVGVDERPTLEVPAHLHAGLR